MIQGYNASLAGLLAPRLRKNRGELYASFIHVGQPGPIAMSKYSVYLATAGAAALVLTLPLAANQPAKVYVVKKIDPGVGTVDITPQGGELIEMAPVWQLAVQFETVILGNDGAGWWLYSIV
jgi:hypothetical protein